MPETIAEKLWNSRIEDAYASLYCPYCVGLAYGTLPSESFLEYLHQDYFYLTIYEFAYRKASKIYEDMGDMEMAKRFSEWADIAIRERAHHENRATKRGIKLENIVPLKPTTDYTNLLREVTNNRPLCDIVSCIHPCGKLYWFIGYFMKRAMEGLPNHDYTEWIDTYASTWMDDLVEVLDQMLNTVPCDDYKSFAHYFDEAIRLEYEFFNQQSGVPPLWTTQYIKNIYLTHNGIYKENDKKYDGVDRFLELGKDYSLNITIDQVEKKEQQSVDSVVVCGPSVEDLEAQLDSKNILLWVQPSAEAQEAMKKKGYTLLSLYRLVGGKKPESLDSKTIYIVENWYEIGFAFIGGHYYTRSYAPHVPTVCICAGSDTGGGAGIQADLKSCTAIGVYSTNIIVALTAQNTQGVQDIWTPSIDFIKSEFNSVFSDIEVDVLKTGMLATKEVIDTVCEMIDKYHITKTIVDPVMVATSGDPLLQDSAVETMKKCLIPRAYLITPNLPEAEFILGHPIAHDIEEMKTAAKELCKMGCKCALIKGGHSAEALEAHDVLYDSVNDKFYTFTSPYVYTRNTHGTGCTLASSISAYFALGNSIEKSVELAKEYIYNCLKESRYLHIGKGRQGPVNHCWKARKWE